MPAETTRRRAVAFLDGQNLFHAARAAFGFTYSNYDVTALAARVCRQRESLTRFLLPSPFAFRSNLLLFPKPLAPHAVFRR
jgi:hypothetical protein